MKDLHSHILPGLDDGARSLEEARELARRCVAEGVTAIAATPHVRSDYPTTPEQMERGVAELRADLAEAGIALEVVHGGELGLDRLGDLTEDDLRRFSFAQGGAYVLLECPYSGSPLELVPAIKKLRASGLTPLLAHPERNPDVIERPSRLGSLVELGVLVQVTAASINGQFGKPAKKTAAKLVELGLVHVIASDSHGPHIREGGLAAAAESLGDPGLARHLTDEVPGAILAGESVAVPPIRPTRRFRVF